MDRVTRTVLVLALGGCMVACGGKRKDGEDADADVVEDAVDISGEEDGPEDPEPDPAIDVEEEEDALEDPVEEDVVDEDAPPPPPDLLYVHTVAGDYSAGSYSVIELDSMTVHGDIATMHTDGKALCFEDQVFLNELMGADTVDPLQTASPFGVVDRHDVGESMNPVDAILRDATHLLVVQYGGTGLVELDLSSGSLTGTTVDLSSFDENDDSPQAHAIAHVGSRYYVSIQRLNGWTAEDPGLVLVLDDTSLALVDVDTSTPSVMDGIVLPGTNPIGRFRRLGSRLYIALSGAWGATDGGIAVVDTTSLTASWSVQGSTIGGDPVFGDCWEIVSNTTGYVGYGLDDGSADAVKSFDPGAGTAASTTILTTSAGSLSGSALTPDGRMIVGDRDSSSPGLRVIDISSGTETTTSPLAAGTHPPYSLCTYDPT